MDTNFLCRKCQIGRSVVFLALTAAIPIAARARIPQQNQTVTHLVTKKGEFTLKADSQREAAKVFFADGNVNITYEDVSLRADHVEYNEQTKVAEARGHIRFDHQNQHLEADSANYNFETERGTFQNVRGTVKAQHVANPNVLVSPNPLTFSAAEVERTDAETFVVKHAWLTVCKPNRPKWKFYAPRAVIHLQKSVTLENATFHLFYVPVIYLPRASMPAKASKLK